ncbi:hypothetical protein H112_00641 [Trichophyton rubrum D6]|uniref:Uncharacterized protein n=3 Tax=Trichophyton rubrum TaxID=5551 RepID=A0A178F535_TRIRU|nr:uncharacterized protein TERG_07763 [Trichophyton rubrum CBS 118892]EZF27344.1 hypothetical protein H100_00641 [Trichophyton rubrum MR850]EZF46386.1 hypothetical protein H102_00638 [Trichophyton rubrum CBS 100081]EZF67641.1 hypothetical protein H104_00627 [Trichophyton rubrum CBS 289.86]EZF88941.1 hypothetical protein H110_00645 [Trichophyton rubrum MR1448]EZF99747.1 hypothetical protein H113_00644 [Trichophyton rubrum MR1459]EZG21313.1 hypothetical protein H107_00685 [Trichophyton rubrum C
MATKGRHRDKWHHWASSPRHAPTSTVRSLVSRMKSKLSPLDSTKMGAADSICEDQEPSPRDMFSCSKEKVEASEESPCVERVPSTPAISTASSSVDIGNSTMVSPFSPPDRARSTTPSEERSTKQEVEGSSGSPSPSADLGGDDVFGPSEPESQVEPEDDQEPEETGEMETATEVEVDSNEEASVQEELEEDLEADMEEDLDYATDTGASSEFKEIPRADSVDDEGYGDKGADEEGKEEVGGNKEQEEEEEMIPSREVDFLLENAEVTRRNDLAALQDEFDDEIRYLADERNQLLTEKMFWQTKFVTAIKGREKQRSRASSLTEDNSRMDAINKMLQREMGLIQDIIDKQYKDMSEIKSNCLGTVTQLTQACEVTKTYIDKAKEENMKTAKELAILRKVVMKIRQPSKKLTEFSMHHDFKQALEVNQELKSKTEAQQEELDKLQAQLAERDAKIKSLQLANTKLEEQLDDLETYNAKYMNKLEEASRSLTYYQKSLLQARDKETQLNDRLATALGEWASKKRKFKNELVECRAKLQLKDTMINALHGQSSIYLENWKETINMLSEKSQGDELSVKLADCLQETLDRNEALEIELGELREKTLTVLNQSLS